MKNSMYYKDFKTFLSYTNEKEILLSEIASDIEKYNVKSLLDIGAGNGLLSIPLSAYVKKYVAVESHKPYAKKLQQAGLRAIARPFPFSLNEIFDMVLICHALSYKTPYRTFLRGAWRNVSFGGHLLFITYRAGRDDWTLLMDAVGIPVHKRNAGRFSAICNLLETLGDLHVRKVTTYVTTPTKKEMISALAFVASGGDEEKKKHFLFTDLDRILLPYKKGETYSFPFHHFFILVQKPRP